MPGLGGSDVTVTIGGNSQGGQQSVQQMIASLRDLQGQLRAISGTHQQFAQSTRVAGEAADGLTNVLTRGLDTLKNWAMQAASVAVGMASFRIFEDAAGWVSHFADEMFNLNVTTERNQYMWQYQFGGPKNGGPEISKQISAWLPNFAMQAPYTLQDIMTAVAPMSQMGLSFQGLQRYMPLVADLAATHTSIFGGNGPLPIQYAALAIMEAATTGNARRLMMEMQIHPRELEAYGLKFEGNGSVSGQIQNPQMFFPALEAWAKDKGYTGAAAKVAKETWWGTWSSFIDRIQKFQIRAGGTYVAPVDATKDDYTKGGTIASGSTFQVMKDGLNFLSDWYDKHERELFKLADTLAQLGGTGFKLLGQGALGLFDGLKASGVGDDALSRLKDAVSWLADPKHQEEIKKLGDTLGKNLGQGIKDLATNLQLIKDTLKEIQAALKDTHLEELSGVLMQLNPVLLIFTSSIVDGLKALGDLAKLIDDMAHGDWGAAWSDAQAFLKDWADSLTGGYASKTIQSIQQVAGGNGQVAAATYQTPQPASRPAGHGQTAESVVFGGGGTVQGAPSTIIIHGATDSHIQRLVNQAQGKREVQLASDWRAPGGYGFGVVGL